MKKVFFSLAVLCSVALVSCGGNKAAEAAVDSESIQAEEVTETVVAAPESGETVVAVAEEVAVAETPAESAK